MKPITLRKVSRESWRAFLEHCHDAGVSDPEDLLEVFLSSPDAIRAAIALQRQREAARRATVVEIGGRPQQEE